MLDCFQPATFYFFLGEKGRWGWGFPYDHDQNVEVQQCTRRKQALGICFVVLKISFP
jgi:hypothetical protein